MRRLLPLLCGLLLAACGQRAARPIGDFTLPVYTPRYASGFEITGAAGSRSTLVTVHNPWYGDEVTDQYLFIARDGEPAPAGFEGQVLRDEARRVVCMSGSYIAMLDALGAADRVVGVSGAQYLINETLRRRIARGEAADVGFDSNVDFERLMALRPDLVMLFGIGGADTALTGKLRELGIPYLYMGEHCEESPLGKSEWVVVAAEIAGLRTEGSRLFAAIPERYERLRALAQQTAARPRVMLNTPYRDTWFMPARNSYMVRLLEDAGARYVFEENTATQTLPIDIEQAYYLTSKSDFWLNVSGCNTLDEVRRYQAVHQPKVMAGGMAFGASKVLPYNFRDVPVDSLEEEFGMLDRFGRPKPAIAGFRAAAKLLGRARFSGFVKGQARSPGWRSKTPTGATC